MLSSLRGTWETPPPFGRRVKYIGFLKSENQFFSSSFLLCPFFYVGISIRVESRSFVILETFFFLFTTVALVRIAFRNGHTFFGTAVVASRKLESWSWTQRDPLL